MLALGIIASSQAAEAREYFVGGPAHEHDMEIVANYLIGIEMAPMPAGMAMGEDVIHLEADVHATADNVYGYQDGEWVPYLTIEYLIEKQGSAWKADGKLRPMTAKDGPHYADNVKMLRRILRHSAITGSSLRQAKWRPSPSSPPTDRRHAASSDTAAA